MIIEHRSTQYYSIIFLVFKEKLKGIAYFNKSIIGSYIVFLEKLWYNSWTRGFYKVRLAVIL